MKEKSLWKWLKKAEQSVVPGTLHWRRVEDSLSIGIPDVEGCYGGKCFVVELKEWVTSWKGGYIHHTLTGHQVMFLHSRVKAGGRAWLLVQIDGKCRYLIPGAVVKAIFQDCGTVLTKELTQYPIVRTPHEALCAMTTAL